MRERVSDALHSQTAESAANGAFVVLDAVQHLGSPARQLIGLGCAMRVICDTLSFDPNEIFRVVSRMEQDCRHRQVNTLSAVRKYAENEMRQLIP